MSAIEQTSSVFRLSGNDRQTSFKLAIKVSRMRIQTLESEPNLKEKPTLKSFRQNQNPWHSGRSRTIKNANATYPHLELLLSPASDSIKRANPLQWPQPRRHLPAQRILNPARCCEQQRIVLRKTQHL
jgi:hypothetical protein